MSAPATPPLLELKGVSVRFGSFLALDHLDFHIRHGEVVGLLGDNGAGKSTTIKMMSGTTLISGGQVLVDGKPVAIRNRKESEAIGIETIYQDSALVDQISITRTCTALGS